jgi:hypothetical protein
MNALPEPQTMLLDEAPMLELDPDILILAGYLARKNKMTLSGFIENLIAKEAGNRSRASTVEAVGERH